MYVRWRQGVRSRLRHMHWPSLRTPLVLAFPRTCSRTGLDSLSLFAFPLLYPAPPGHLTRSPHPFRRIYHFISSIIRCSKFRRGMQRFLLYFFYRGNRPIWCLQQISLRGFRNRATMLQRIHHSMPELQRPNYSDAPYAAFSRHDQVRFPSLQNLHLCSSLPYHEHE